MARQPKVEVDGNPMPNVREVKYGLRAALDRDGAPTRGLICDGIMIRRVADAATDICEWAANADEASRKSGKVTFLDANGLEMKALSWENGYVREYFVEYDDSGDHVEEVFVVESEIISVGDEKHSFDWKNK
jgi:hypothetical protein